MDLSIKTILCATDFSECSKHALAFAQLLARQFNARLYLCHIIDMSYASMYGYGACLAPGEPEKIVMKSVEDHFRECACESPLTCEALVAKGHPAVEIARAAEETHADIVVVGTHGRSGAKWLILGSIAERLMKTMTCPLITVNLPRSPGTPADFRTYRLERILVGSDFSIDAELACTYGLSLAKGFRAELHLVHVQESDRYGHGHKTAGETDKTGQAALAEALDARLLSMIPDGARLELTCRTAVLSGRPWEALNRYARDKGINLIVLGARGHSLVDTLFLGSCTDRLTRQAPCPVLSVRSPGGERH